MKKKEIVISIIIVAVVIIYAGYLTYRDVQNSPNTGASSTLIDWKNYTNNEYGFKLIFPDSWKEFVVVKQTWQGWAIDGSGKTYSGSEIVIKNPQTTAKQQYQDIPIMVFTTDMWKLVGDERTATVAISAAPIGPAEIGENAKYVFATPPRWYGFTDAIGWQEAIDILKTFKGL